MSEADSGAAGRDRVRFSASISWLFRDADLEYRFAKAKAAGFEGVEIQDMSEAPLPVIDRAARNTDLPVVLINIGLGDFPSGGPGLSGVPGREREFASAAARAAEAAHLLKVQWVNLGPSRVLRGEPRPRCAEILTENANRAVDWLKGSGAGLLIEPFNAADSPDSVVVTHGEAAAVARRAGAAGVLFDAYHAARAGEDVAGAFCANLGDVRHVQFADSPGRGAPGTGQTDLDGFFTVMLQGEYSGWAGAEYAPVPAVAANFDWLDKLRSRRTRVRDCDVM